MVSWLCELGECLREWRSALLRSVALSAMALLSLSAGAALADPDEAWMENWEVAPGFALERDATGFDFPSSIAFVPHPGPGPKDPLYFVTELRNRIKVVTNDRSVHVFAEDFFHLEPFRPLEESSRLPELGMAGLGLDEENGYVFVSFSYYDDQGMIRNNVVRFETVPGVFATKPSGKLEFTDIFEDQPADDSHMIGPVVVHDGLLYVNVGDAHLPSLTQDLNFAVGKILRMTLDGDPVPSNPFYQDSDRKKPVNYVWAYGLRNPFGIKFVRGIAFVTDVGPAVDRFLVARPGANYGYDGTDWSIGSHADIAFWPSVSPVQIDYHPLDHGPFPPPYRGKFYVATSGHQGAMGPTTHGEKAVLVIDYDFEKGEIVGRPHQLLKYRGNRGHMPVGVGFGPGGLYVVTLAADRSLKHDILRIVYRPARPHPFVIGGAQTLMENRGCAGCHRDGLGAPAPALRRETLIPRLRARLNSREYLETSRHVDALETEPFVSYRAARQEVRDAEGQQRVLIWIRNHLVEPRFDNPDAIMPNLGLSRDDAMLIARYLTGELDTPWSLRGWIVDYMSERIPTPRLRHLLMFLVAGGAIGFTGGVTLMALLRLWRSRG